MDAKVTKHRLGNMLSYDWLKILCTIAVAVAALVLLFTMISPKPARAQKFIVHLYGGLEYGNNYQQLQPDLESILSYDTLDVQIESFDSGMMSSASYTARRSAGEGTVAFAADYAEKEGDTTPFADLLQRGMQGGELNMFWQMDAYFSSLDEYMVRFFGESWKDAPVLDGAEVERCFRARNVEGPNNKNRFRSDAEIAAGIAEETARLEKLRGDYLYLIDEAGLGSEKLPYVSYTTEIKNADGEVVETKTFVAGVSLNGLKRMSDILYYEDADGKLTHEGALVYLIYRNGGEDPGEGTNDGRADLKFEAVTFLKYLVERYS